MKTYFSYVRVQEYSEKSWETGSDASRERAWEIGNWVICKCMKAYFFYVEE